MPIKAKPPEGNTRDYHRAAEKLPPEPKEILPHPYGIELGRLAANAQQAIGFTMDRDRDRIGRDSMDESTEEELYSTQLRLHDRENFLIAKIQEYDSGDNFQHRNPADVDPDFRFREHQYPLLAIMGRHEWAPGQQTLALARGHARPR